MEKQILERITEWGLHDSHRGRLSVLRQLAILQHNHAPTRLIDVSLNPYIATWFAVEPESDGFGYTFQEPQSDGRIFAIGTSERLLSDNRADWEDRVETPWSSGTTVNSISPSDWCSQVQVWIPAPAEPRIAAQHGAFLLGGVPNGSSRLPGSTTPNSWLSNDEARRLTSVALRFHKVNSKRGGVSSSGSPAYTWRITKGARREILGYLSQQFAYGTGRIYPDFPGFGKFGVPDLASRPPMG